MIDNELKKMIIFSSMESRRVLESIIKERAQIEGATQSRFVEQTLEKALLPAHPDAKSWVKKLYSGSTVDQVLCDIYDHFLLNQKRDALIQFVSYHSIWLHYEWNHIYMDEEGDKKLRNAWNNIIELLEGKEKTFASKLLNMFPFGGTESIATYFLETIEDNWDILGSSIATVRFLKMVAQYAEIRGCRQESLRRKELCRTILTCSLNTEESPD